jgi:uncharacterized protein (DUF1810 family)
VTTPASDPHNLQRFVDAQASVFSQVLAELRAGRKRSHWMWFIFPQIAGLGSSDMAQHFAISGRAEAEAYLAHPTLGPRLRQCTELVNQVPTDPALLSSRSAAEGSAFSTTDPNRTVSDIFGYPDDLKFRSSITLFASVAPAEPAFAAALLKYFAGKPDPATLARL